MVVNVWAAINYICSYVTKSEKELGETMVEVLRAIPEGTPAVQRLRKIANAFMGARSVSAQEAIHRILGLYMLKKSREVHFISSGFPQHRHRLLKSKAQRAKLDFGASVSDLFVDGTIQKYEKRDCSEPDVASMSLATFAAFYDGNGERPSRSTAFDDNPMDCSGDDASESLDDASGDERASNDDSTTSSSRRGRQVSFTSSAAVAAASPPQERLRSSSPSSVASGVAQTSSDLPDSVQLVKGSGDDKRVIDTLRKRKRERILRFCGFEREGQEEEAAYSRLLLFRPFQNEERDMDLSSTPYSSYQQWLEAVWDQVRDGVETYDPYGHMMAKAMEEMTSAKREKLRKANIAADDPDGGYSDSGSDDDAVEELLDPDDLQLDVLQGIVADDASDAPPSRAFTVREGFEGYSKEELVSELATFQEAMNIDQKAAFAACVRCIRDYKEAQTTGKRYRGRPIFISGPGGRRCPAVSPLIA